MVRSRLPLTLKQELDLHRRLVEGDPVAPSDLAQAYLEPVLFFLRNTSASEVPRDFLEDAVHEALISLIKHPTAFDAARSRAHLPLFAYLKMAAKGDLQNILKKEEPHRRGRTTLESVELSPQARKYLSIDDDPSRRLELQDEASKANRVATQVRSGLSDGEQSALQLILQGERKTTAFVSALGIGHLSKEDQKAEVKRVKDKLKTRIKRGTRGDGERS